MFITLYVDRGCPYCQQVRWVLAEKNIPYQLVELSPTKDKAFIEEHNPYGTLPILKERDRSIYDANVIMFYLDERYPSPSLMPQYPVVRAKTRLAMMRIEKDWYSMLKLVQENGAEAKEAAEALKDSFQAISPIFADSDYFMSEELTLADGALAILLHKLSAVGIELESKSEIKKYAERMFAREAFQDSLLSANQHKFA
ncbi:glutathione S-transferase N-terminal domain-containing protein [Francisellaceae bacterium]|nr:glutathione S-transferase N-terminal domain-containing protein [Francisellaceae bacterium]